MLFGGESTGAAAVFVAAVAAAVTVAAAVFVTVMAAAVMPLALFVAAKTIEQRYVLMQ